MKSNKLDERLFAIFVQRHSKAGSCKINPPLCAANERRSLIQQRQYDMTSLCHKMAPNGELNCQTTKTRQQWLAWKILLIC